MIEDKLNGIIVNAILEHIPTGEKPVSYIMKVLGLSRESVYRRLRKEIPFSVAELAKLALSLEISVDRIIEKSEANNFSFDLRLKKTANSANAYIKLFQVYNHYLQNVIKTKDSETFMALNEIPPLFTILSDNLFKFDYYKWFITNKKKSKQCSFSDLSIPDELLTMRKKAYINIQQVNNVSVLFSPTTYLSLIKNIQYYYHRKLLTRDELLLLKNDILDFINLGEKIVTSGYYNPNSKVDFYLSPLFINSNILYLKYGKTAEAHFWVYQNIPLIVQNPEICSIQKEWFQSLKKRSTLISLSNEILQAGFYTKQREYVKAYLVEDAVPSYLY
jgi:hypothetical protein